MADTPLQAQTKRLIQGHVGGGVMAQSLLFAHLTANGAVTIVNELGQTEIWAAHANGRDIAKTVVLSKYDPHAVG